MSLVPPRREAWDFVALVLANQNEGNHEDYLHRTLRTQRGEKRIERIGAENEKTENGNANRSARTQTWNVKTRFSTKQAKKQKLTRHRKNLTRTGEAQRKPGSPTRSVSSAGWFRHARPTTTRGRPIVTCPHVKVVRIFGQDRGRRPERAQKPVFNHHLKGKGPSLTGACIPSCFLYRFTPPWFV